MQKEDEAPRERKNTMKTKVTVFKLQIEEQLLACESVGRGGPWCRIPVIKIAGVQRREILCLS